MRPQPHILTMIFREIRYHRKRKLWPTYPAASTHANGIAWGLRRAVEFAGRRVLQKSDERIVAWAKEDINRTIRAIRERENLKW